MTLDLNDHLLETPDSLVATILVELLVGVVLGVLDRGVLGVLHVFLALIRNVLLSLSREVLCSLLESCATSFSVIVAWVLLSTVHALIGSILSLFTAEWLVLVELITSLGSEVVSRQIGNVVPRVVFGRIVDSVQSVFGRVYLACDILSSIASNIAHQGNGVAHELAELPIRENQPAESLEAIEGLITVLTSRVFVYRSVGGVGNTAVQVLSIPDKLRIAVSLCYLLAQRSK